MLGAGENLAVRTRLVEDKVDKIIIEKKVEARMIRLSEPIGRRKRKKKQGLLW